MRKVILAMALASTALVGAPAFAQDAPPPPPPGAHGMMRADADGDRVITRAEAIVEADRRFDRLDTNHDGKVTPDEMRVAFEAMRARREARDDDTPPPPPGDHPMPGMKGHGPMAGGVMTKADAEARAAERFDRMDTNHDGKLDRTELANAREMHRERRDWREDGAPPPPPPPPASQQ